MPTRPPRTCWTAALTDRAKALGLTALEAEIYDYNEASRRLFTGAGFVRQRETPAGAVYRLAL